MSNVVNSTSPANQSGASLVAHAHARRLQVPASAGIWDSMLASWSRSLRAANKADGTIKAYAKSYRRLAIWACDPARGYTDPEAITKAQLEDFFDYELHSTTQRGTPMQASTVAGDYRHLRVFFNWLAGEENPDDPRSVMRNMTAPSVPEKLVPIITDKELQALLGTCSGATFADRRDTAILRVLLDAGLRHAELAGLEVDDVDLDAQLLLVTGKGSRQREVAIGAKTTEALDRYLRMRAKHKDRNRTQALWLAAYPRRGAVEMSGIRLIVKRRAADAGLAGIHLHKFRHTAAHAVLAAGMNEGEAMRHFGWRSRTMVDRYGASAASQRAQATARRLSTGDRV